MSDIKWLLIYSVQTSAHSGDATNVQIQPYERSMTPLQDFFVDPAMCYHPNGYPYAAHYYGIDIEFFFFGEKKESFVNPS